MIKVKAFPVEVDDLSKGIVLKQEVVLMLRLLRLYLLSPVPAIPQIVGDSPPTYPGNKPDHTADTEALQKWTVEAKLFVRFYSYLFLPWDSELDPRDPTLPHLQVLPWDDNTSWNNFCTILKSWRFQSPEEEDSSM